MPRTALRPADAQPAAPLPIDRVAALDWDAAAAELDQHGAAVLPALLSPEECRAVAALYSEDKPFRSRVVMARHGFGRGEYKYFAYPLPAPVAGLRAALYPRLAPVANGWNARMGIATRYPERHEDLLEACHAAGQARPTPLLLQYEPGDFN
ncbi:2OG-Fe(II) oxygenase, partial [Inquilinus limosus]